MSEKTLLTFEDMPDQFLADLVAVSTVCDYRDASPHQATVRVQVAPCGINEYGWRMDATDGFVMHTVLPFAALENPTTFFVPHVAVENIGRWCEEWVWGKFRLDLETRDDGLGFLHDYAILRAERPAVGLMARLAQVKWPKNADSISPLELPDLSPITEVALQPGDALRALAFLGDHRAVVIFGRTGLDPKKHPVIARSGRRQAVLMPITPEANHE